MMKRSQCGLFGGGKPSASAAYISPVAGWHRRTHRAWSLMTATSVRRRWKPKYRAAGRCSALRAAGDLDWSQCQRQRRGGSTLDQVGSLELAASTPIRCSRSMARIRWRAVPLCRNENGTWSPPGCGRPCCVHPCGQKLSNRRHSGFGSWNEGALSAYWADMMFWILLAVLTAACSYSALPALRGAKAADDTRAGEGRLSRPVA